MLVVLGYGVIRLTYFLPEPGTVRIHGIVETDYTRYTWETELFPLSQSDPEAFRAQMTPVYERYLEATLREAQAGAQIVVWPEVAAEGFKEDLDEVVARAQDIARQEGIYLSVGLNVIGPGSYSEGENRLVLIDPNGDILVDYLKYGCMAFNMYSVQVPTVETPYGTLGAVLCCDLDYPYVIRQVSQKGVDILLVPSYRADRRRRSRRTRGWRPSAPSRTACRSSARRRRGSRSPSIRTAGRWGRWMRPA